MEFAKLFELENDEQVLITREWSIENDQFEITFSTSLPTAMARIVHGFKDEKRYNEVWSKVNAKMANDFRFDMENI